MYQSHYCISDFLLYVVRTHCDFNQQADILIEDSDQHRLRALSVMHKRLSFLQQVQQPNLMLTKNQDITAAQMLVCREPILSFHFPGNVEVSSTSVTDSRSRNQKMIHTEKAQTHSLVRGIPSSLVLMLTLLLLRCLLSGYTDLSLHS